MKNAYASIAKDLILENKLELIPPSVEIDLSNNCNQACIYCNVEQYMIDNKSVAKFNDFIALIDQLKEWPSNSELKGQVNTICFVGGGEPTVFKRYEKIIEYAIEQGFLVSLVTNGINLDKLLKIRQENLKKIAWVGVDIDAAEEQLYELIRKPKSKRNLEKVKRNIVELVKRGVNVDLKILLLKENCFPSVIDDIFVFAKETDVRMVYFRLANIDLNVFKVSRDIIKYIKNKSGVLGVKIRINESRALKRNYKKCYALYLLPVFSADGFIYTCCENRGNDFFNLGNWINSDLSKLWMSEKHHYMFENLNLDKCPTCRPNIHNIEIQNIINNPSQLEDLFL